MCERGRCFFFFSENLSYNRVMIETGHIVGLSLMLIYLRRDSSSCDLNLDEIWCLSWYLNSEPLERLCSAKAYQPTFDLIILGLTIK